MELYDLEDVYDKEISPLMKQIIDICKKNKMPMVASFAYESDEEKGVGQCSTNLFFDDRKHENFIAANTEINRSGRQQTIILTMRK